MALIRQRKNKVATLSLLNRWLDCEEDFHVILVEAARNRLLSKIIRDHRAITRVFDAHRNEPYLLTAEVAEATCRGRQELIDSLRARDGKLSRRLMSDQIKVGRRTVGEHLNRRRRTDSPS